MLKLFKSDQLAKACKAVEHGDLERLTKCLKKISKEQLNQPISDSLPSLTEYCIQLQSPKALSLILDHGGDPDLTSRAAPGKKMTDIALEQENSLPLLTALFKAGSKEDPSELVIRCFDSCEPQSLMLHLSFLLQQGAQLSDRTVHLALTKADLALIHFVINSGAERPNDLNEQGYSEKVVSYADKCWEDIKIRKMFL